MVTGQLTAKVKTPLRIPAIGIFPEASIPCPVVPCIVLSYKDLYACIPRL